MRGLSSPTPQLAEAKLTLAGLCFGKQIHFLGRLVRTAAFKQRDHNKTHRTHDETSSRTWARRLCAPCSAVLCFKRKSNLRVHSHPSAIFTRWHHQYLPTSDPARGCEQTHTWCSVTTLVRYIYTDNQTYTERNDCYKCAYFSLQADSVLQTMVAVEGQYWMEKLKDLQLSSFVVMLETWEFKWCNTALVHANGLMFAKRLYRAHMCLRKSAKHVTTMS